MTFPQRHPHAQADPSGNERQLIWGLVLSRKNSKRLPGKTMRPLAGKPMIAYTFDAANGSQTLETSWIFSDDPEAIALAKTSGIQVPRFDRPDDVSGDKSSTEDTVRYFLSQFPKEELPDYLVLLQATSPMRNSDDIDQAVGTLLGHSTLKADGLVSVCQPPKPLEWLYEHHPDTLTVTPITHDTSCWKMPNGAIYIFKPQDLLGGKALMSGQIIGYDMPWRRSIDIDTLEDFLFAEALLNHSLSNSLTHKAERHAPNQAVLS